jgi:hypothetical protein
VYVKLFKYYLRIYVRETAGGSNLTLPAPERIVKKHNRGQAQAEHPLGAAAVQPQLREAQADPGPALEVRVATGASAAQLAGVSVAAGG